MKPRIYIETSVIGYLAARPSLDAISDCLTNLGVPVPLIATPEDIMESLP